MSTKNTRPNNGKGQEKNETATVAIVETKPTNVQKNQPKTDVFADLMKHLNELEDLIRYYNKLKIKRDTLQQAHNKMKKFESSKKDKFEEGSKNQFPFEIVVRGEGENNRPDDLFTISKVNTVTAFTEYLLNEIHQLLEVFEADILEHSKRLK